MIMAAKLDVEDQVQQPTPSELSEDLPRVAVKKKTHHSTSFLDLVQQIRKGEPDPLIEDPPQLEYTPFFDGPHPFHDLKDPIPYWFQASLDSGILREDMCIIQRYRFGRTSTLTKKTGRLYATTSTTNGP